MSQQVLKFGGSSLNSPEKIKSVAKIITDKKQEYDNLVVVVSAMGKTTNDLIKMAHEISDYPSKREMDVLLSSGEQVSISLLAMALHSLGYDSISLTGWQAGIRTYGNNTKQKIKDIDLKRIYKELHDNKIVIVAGFQGFDEYLNISTLGRGGSDTSAVALASALGCDCAIYSDVAGLYTLDPNLNPNAKIIPYVSYEECMEMAGLGASIIEARAVDLASRYNTKISLLLNTGGDVGTIIDERGRVMLEENVIQNISVMDDVVLFNVENFGEDVKKVLDLFNHFSKTDVNIDVISQSFHHDISFTTKKEDLKEVIRVVHSMTNKKIDYMDNVIKISVIGNGMRYQSGVAAKVYEVFARNNINFYQVSTSEISISYIVDAVHKEKIVNALAKTFNLLGDDHNES